MSLLTADSVTLTERDFQKIREMIYKHCGINLHEGKRELVRARLAKQIRVGHFRSFDDYLDHVFQDKTGRAFSTLVDALSTNLTSFFREQRHFDFLQQSYLPRLKQRKSRQGCQRIRAWSAGCSSGEEPYSIAITLLDAFQRQGIWDIKVLGTDISTRILERARRGCYESARVKPVPPVLKQRYLIKRGIRTQAKYEVGPDLLKTVSLAYLNLMDEWPIRGPLDIIFCRNVMIYFDKPTQEFLVNRFYRILDSGGILFTGHSESLTGIRHNFRYIQPTIYVKS